MALYCIYLSLHTLVFATDWSLNKAVLFSQLVSIDYQREEVCKTDHKRSFLASLTSFLFLCTFASVKEKRVQLGTHSYEVEIHIEVHKRRAVQTMRLSLLHLQASIKWHLGQLNKFFFQLLSLWDEELGLQFSLYTYSLTQYGQRFSLELLT